MRHTPRTDMLIEQWSLHDGESLKHYHARTRSDLIELAKQLECSLMAARDLLKTASALIDESVWSYREMAKHSVYGSDEWKRFHAMADAAIVTRGKIEEALCT